MSPDLLAKHTSYIPASIPSNNTLTTGPRRAGFSAETMLVATSANADNLKRINFILGFFLEEARVVCSVCSCYVMVEARWQVPRVWLLFLQSCMFFFMSRSLLCHRPSGVLTTKEIMILVSLMSLTLRTSINLSWSYCRMYVWCTTVSKSIVFFVGRKSLFPRCIFLSG